MSAPPQVPYYRPRPRSIVGPLVLITIGVLFLLRTTGVISFQSFRNWMVQYWPLLLIFCMFYFGSMLRLNACE